MYDISARLSHTDTRGLSFDLHSFVQLNDTSLDEQAERKHPWTIVHTFFVVMGELMIVKSLILRETVPRSLKLVVS